MSFYGAATNIGGGFVTGGPVGGAIGAIATLGVGQKTATAFDSGFLNDAFNLTRKARGEAPLSGAEIRYILRHPGEPGYEAIGPEGTAKEKSAYVNAARTAAANNTGGGGSSILLLMVGVVLVIVLMRR